MIRISDRRGTMMASGIVSAAIIVIIITLIASTGAWRPKCKYAFGGVWLMTTPAHEHAWFVIVESPVDITGKRSAVCSWLQTGDPPSGFDPELANWIGGSQLVSTGKYTYRESQAMYAVTGTTHTKYIFLTESEGRWIDENTRETTVYMAIYLKSQDADGDGLPDPGQSPIHVGSGREYYLKRLPWFDVKTE
jgi:hypothetical protein